MSDDAKFPDGVGTPASPGLVQSAITRLNIRTESQPFIDINVGDWNGRPSRLCWSAWSAVPEVAWP